jgi:uncharacterized protein YjdB
MNRFNSLTKPLMWFMALLTVTFVAGCGGTTSSVDLPSVVSVSITPATPSIPISGIQQFTATATYSDGLSHNVTTAPGIAWSSADTGKATISATGMATGVANGTSVITAAIGGKSATTTLTVTAETLLSIAVTPAASSIPVTTTQQFTAIAAYSFGTHTDVTAATGMVWSSSATGIATIGSGTGLATGVASGSAVITATFGGKTATANLTVNPAILQSIAVTPATASVPAGLTQQFTATATYDYGPTVNVTTAASWTSGTAGATVGLHTGLATGVTANATPVVITASFGGKNATAALTVTAASVSSIAVTPLTPSIAISGTQQFTATATYSDTTTANVTAASGVVWTSSDPTKATIVSNTGLATGVAAGTTDITAAFGGQTSPADTLTVTAAAGPPMVDLRSILTNNFVILAQSMITEATPVNGAITGNIGVSPAAGSTITVACAEMLTGKVYQVDDTYTGGASCSLSGTVSGGANKTTVDNAVADMGLAYTAASDPATPAGVGASNLDLLGGNLPAGTNFVPGVYTWGSNVNINGNITLTGSASDVWIFQMSGNLAVASCGSCSSAADLAAIKVNLSGGAVASNVFWQVGGSTTTLGTYSTFNGNILTAPAGLIAIQTGAVLHGRALSGTSVALDGNIVGP